MEGDLIGLAFPRFRLPKMGIFSWDLAENKLVADEFYASLYDFDPAELACGIEIERVIGRILKDDQESAARSTRAAIINGNFGTISFRVKRGPSIVDLGAYGRCLRDEEGLPSVFTGAAFELRETNVMNFN